MATSNFHNVNASHIFACSLENEWDFEDLKDNLTYEFKNLDGFDTLTKSDPSELRSFPSTSICSVSRQHIYNNFSLDVIVTIVARSGYYEGCNLDWHVTLYVNGYQDDTYADDANVLRISNEYVDFIETIYSQYSEPLGVTARFSNGETIYHKVA